VPQVILQVFIIMLYENVFQNPELFPTQVSLSPEHSTLALVAVQQMEKTTMEIRNRYFSVAVNPWFMSDILWPVKEGHNPFGGRGAR
jgi:hypothetical protein